MARNIQYIFVHCSAGSQANTAADIISYHTRPKANGGCGWSRPGYHYIIEADGKIVKAVDESISANGAGPKYNPISVHVCYIGGVDTSQRSLPPVDNRTPAQKASLLSLLRLLRKRYPSAKIIGHRDVAAKACPSFDATKEYASI